MSIIKKHPEYKLNTSDVDFTDFRVLLVYANSPMDNLFPVGLSSIAGMLTKHKINYNSGKEDGKWVWKTKRKE